MDATWRRRISPLRVEQLAREGFDEAQPYLTGGGVGGHGVTQPMDGDARSDSDGGGVDELTRTRAHEGGSQHGPRLPVDDELGLTVGIVAQEGSSSSRGVTDLGGDDVVVEGRALCSVKPLEASWGSVKTTCGTGMLSGTGSDSQPAAWAAILSPTTRARYLPMWVNWASPLASPTA